MLVWWVPLSLGRGTAECLYVVIYLSLSVDKP